MGVCLNKHSAVRRIMYADCKALAQPSIKLLQLFWEVREFKHLKVDARLAEFTNPRLAGVWSKLLAWKLMAGEFDKVLLLDTDLVVVGSVDAIFQGPAPAAVMRGTGDWSPEKPRPAESYFRNRDLVGGINGGVVILVPDADEHERMLTTLPHFAPRASTQVAGAEQDFLSWYFAGRMHALHRCWNFQVHQLSLSGRRASDQSELMKLMRCPKDVKIWHFSTDYKPAHVMLGTATPMKGKQFDKPWFPSRFANTICDIMLAKAHR